jgi:hypothetical protein
VKGDGEVGGAPEASGKIEPFAPRAAGLTDLRTMLRSENWLFKKMGS